MISPVFRDLPDTWEGQAPRCAVCTKPAYQLCFCEDCPGSFLCSRMCHGTYHRIRRHVYEQNQRAAQKGCEATLTLEEFLKTLQYFHGCCAYCQVTQHESIDHYKPVSLGGGTTRQNCIPSCRYCNSKKGIFSGGHLRYVFGDTAYERIMQFLRLR